MAERVVYGKKWGPGVDDLQIEMWFIQQGGYFDKDGKRFGMGLEHHYEQMRRILWPYLDDHRWHRLCRDTIIQNKTVVLLGAGSCGKTHEAAWFALCYYFCFPNETLVLVSSTDMRGLRLRIWGEISMLWEKALQRFPYLPGHMIDSRVAITTQSLEDDGEGFDDSRRIRDMRQGIIGIPTVQGGKQVGLGKWVGVKQKKVLLIADEGSMMSQIFLSAFSNLNKNESFRAIVLGNPNDVMDALGRAAEPVDGWENHMEPERTCTWKTRFMNGMCVNLIGTDSPNFDFPESEPTRYKYLISREKIAETLSFFPKDSVEYYSQCVGIMKVGMLGRRVLTRDMCRRGGAHEDCIWSGRTITKIYFVDASYGGDRCVGGMAEFGQEIGGKTVIRFGEPKIIPIFAKEVYGEPEYQIAEFVVRDCTALGIPPENMGHDATGRGSLGTALGKVWNNHNTNPIDSGGKPTDRPVSMDLYINDPVTRERRPKKCSEHYDRLVTEFWYSVRYAVEAGQVRNLNDEVAEELCSRNWTPVKNGKISVEVKDGTSTKPGMKQRTGKSPDLGDWAAGILEMARRRGFQISKLSNDENQAVMNRDFLSSLATKNKRLMSSATLTHT